MEIRLNCRKRTCNKGPSRATSRCVVHLVAHPVGTASGAETGIPYPSDSLRTRGCLQGTRTGSCTPPAGSSRRALPISLFSIFPHTKYNRCFVCAHSPAPGQESNGEGTIDVGNAVLSHFSTTVEPYQKQQTHESWRKREDVLSPCLDKRDFLPLDGPQMEPRV